MVSQHPNAQRPDVELIRYVQPNESASAQADCLIAAGFVNTTVTPDGGVVTDFGSAAQAEPFAIAGYTCRVQYPLDPKYTAPLTNAEVMFIYDYFVEELTPCLESEGFSVTAAQSRGKFAETYESGTAWHPYEGVIESTTTNEQWWSINARCPQMPTDFRD
ncbi:hypothetical protein DF220_00185 [Salinibacterium hongtaonis]|uniref:Uncharacterized protein n=1 Tax=Homoserinimonas hongtaonis TaxID=2079791 RepID=A0A2U1SXS7_9MICO|nr:hypothetical protein DF220_00185 [Salinibacterium hongtaonis]